MQTQLQLDGANCPTCFNETIDALAEIKGVQKVHGSFSGPCIEVEHDEVVLGEINDVISHHLHGIEMYGNELSMVEVNTSDVKSCCHGHTHENVPSE